MIPEIQTLTAETSEGRRAILEVMEHSYTADIDRVPKKWARVRVVDGTPVSFILVDPERKMELPGGKINYAFILDVATHEKHRNRGHFRAILEDTFLDLRASGISLVVCHGRADLYRRFGFDVFTHHSGIFLTPELIEMKLGTEIDGEASELLVVDNAEFIKDDLLLVSDIKAKTLSECREALKAAAAAARKEKKTRILFEHPRASHPGSEYSPYDSLDTPFCTLARACGGEVRIQGADPEGRLVNHADWIKVLDAAALLREASAHLIGKPESPIPQAAICFDTDAGSAALECRDSIVGVFKRPASDTPRVKWPSSALARLVTGYQSPEVLAAVLGTPLSSSQVELLSTLFPRTWRLSRNEDWTCKS